MLNRLARLADTEMRVASLDAHFHTGSPDDALAALLEAASHGESDARLVTVALAIWRARTGDEALMTRLRATASPLTAPLFASTPARRALSPHARVEPGRAGRAILPRFRARQRWCITNDEGQRVYEVHSYTQHRNAISTEVRPQLLLGLEPWAVPRLLAEPALDLRTVIELATLRPAPGAVLRELSASARWMPRPEVRAALVSNPFSPPWLAYVLRLSLPRQSC
jgi:hypothetical protein